MKKSKLDFYISDDFHTEIGLINTALEINEEQSQEIVKNLKD